MIHLLGTTLASLAAIAPGEETLERQTLAMGTSLWIEVQAPDRATAIVASEAALDALRLVEQRLSTWGETSELARLNASAVGEPFVLSPELRTDLEHATRMRDETGGSFDPGIGALVEVWDLRGGGRRPSPAEIRAACDGTGPAALSLEDGTARRLHAALRIEEGGFGKGVGLDAALAALEGAGALSAVVDLGGQIALLGLGEPRAFPVAHPDDRERVALVLRLSSGSIATSGNSERAIEVDGERLGHILDPRTGRPAPDFGSVTVWAADARSADTLSTALHVMGPERGLAWAESREGVEALFLERRPGGLRARATSGLRGAIDPAGELGIEFTRGDQRSRPSVSSTHDSPPTPQR